MEFCLGCGMDLPQSNKERRNLGCNSTASPAIRDGILSVWSTLMEEVMDQPLNAVFPDVENPGMMCKNCFKVYNTLASKCSKLKERLVLSAKRASGLSVEHEHPATATTSVAGPATATTPSKKRSHGKDQQSVCQRRRLSQHSGSPSVMVSSYQSRDLSITIMYVTS